MITVLTGFLQLEELNRYSNTIVNVLILVKINLLVVSIQRLSPLISFLIFVS